MVGIGPAATVGGTMRRSYAFSGFCFQPAAGAAIEDELIRAPETDDQVTGKIDTVSSKILNDELTLQEPKSKTN